MYYQYIFIKNIHTYVMSELPFPEYSDRREVGNLYTYVKGIVHGIRIALRLTTQQTEAPDHQQCMKVAPAFTSTAVHLQITVTSMDTRT